MKKSQLTELIRTIARRTLNELDSSPGVPLTTTGSSVSSLTKTGDTADGLSSAEQQKMDRLKKQQAQKDLKLRKKEFDQARAKEKSLEKDYKVTRRYTVPNMKRELDAQKRALTKM